MILLVLEATIFVPAARIFPRQLHQNELVDQVRGAPSHDLH